MRTVELSLQTSGAICIGAAFEIGDLLERHYSGFQGGTVSVNFLIDKEDHGETIYAISIGNLPAALAIDEFIKTGEQVATFSPVYQYVMICSLEAGQNFAADLDDTYLPEYIELNLKQPDHNVYPQFIGETGRNIICVLGEDVDDYVIVRQSDQLSKTLVIVPSHRLPA